MIGKRDFIWNMVGSVIQALFITIVSIVLTRVNGVDHAGIFQIAYATATILYAIGDYGMRVYHVTDTKRENSFTTYLYARILANAAMVLAGIIFVVASGYGRTKAIICMCIVLFRFVDGISETYQGEFQLSGRLDLAGKSVTFRNVISMTCFAVTDILTGNVILSFAVIAVMNLVIFLMFDLVQIKKFALRENVRFSEPWSIIVKCFPVFYSTLLNLYVINAPKYAIDKWMTNSAQAYFNVINMPTFTINLMSLFVLKPLLKPLGDYWNDKEYKKLHMVVAKMLLLIIGLIVFVEIACVTIGIPILELLYGLELARYKMDLVYLVISGGFNAMTVMLFYVLTTMRCRKETIIAYTITTIIAFIIPNYLVKSYGITGACLSSIVIMGALCIILFVMYVAKVQECKKVAN